MNKSIDWEKIEQEFEENEAMLNLIDEQIARERRECPENYDLKTQAKIVNEYIASNKLNSINITEKSTKRGE